MTLPHGADGGFQPVGDARGRLQPGREARAHVTAQHGQFRKSGRPVDGDPHEFLGRLGDEILQAALAQHRDADARRHGAPGQSHRGHAHQQAEAGGGRARIGEAVQQQVDVVVEFQVLYPSDKLQHRYQVQFSNRSLHLCIIYNHRNYDSICSLRYQ